MAVPQDLAAFEPFSRLPAAELETLREAALTRTFAAQQLIFQQDDPPTGFLYLVRTGLVEIFVLTPGGVDMVVDYRRPGAYFGGTPVFTGEPYTAAARTVRETTCFLIPAAALVPATEHHPELAAFFSRAVYSRVRSLYAGMVQDLADHALTGIDAYPFQKRLSEIMSAPVPSCSATTSVRTLAREMARRPTGVLLIHENDRPAAGIVTEHDLVTRLLALDSADFEHATAADVMTRDPLTMDAASYMFEATSFMIRNNIKYLPVTDQGEVLGMVTLADLLKYRSHKSMLLVGSTREATSFGQLAHIKLEMTRVARALLEEGRSPLDIMEVLSHIHHAILRRGYELVLAEFAGAGQTPPPVDFTLLLLGSGGRREMLLDPDQDCALIYADVADEQMVAIDRFFIPFSERLIAAWEEIGYPRCKGEVMISNPLWRGRLSDWKERIADWVKTPEPQQVRFANNFFDFMPLVGEPGLAQELRQFAFRQIHEFPLFLYHLMQLDFRHKVPLGLLGRFILDREEEHRGTLSVKQAGSLFIVDCIRMFLLQRQVYASATIERLEQLVRLGDFTRDSAEHIRTAFEALCFLRLRLEIECIEQGRPPTHRLDPGTLSKNEQDLLREAFRVASKLQDSARRHFNVG